MTHKIRWTSPKIAQRLALITPLVYRYRQALPAFRLQLLSHDSDRPDLDPNADDQSWELVTPNSYWINFRTNFVLRTTFEVPLDWPADAEVGLHLHLGKPGDFSHPEALAYIDGQPHAACDRHHQEFLLPPSVRDGETHTLLLHGWSGLDGWFQGKTDAKLFMEESAVVSIDRPTRAFVALARLTLETADVLDEHDPAKGHLLTALNNAFNRLDLRHPLDDRFYESVPAALAILQEEVETAGESLNVELYAAGHAHIDVAWLWTLAQTRHKAERSFHTVLRLMEQFPHYHFSQSQPQLYDYVKQDNMELFEQIKSRVEEGRWETLGGMWVEADCNLTGSEALARQFLLGRTFFRDHFGAEAESPILWLPDVFGYAWNLPQLIKAAGLDYFFTIKISWNQYNRLPYDSFWWQGLDGTRILTHFSPTQEPWAAQQPQPSPSTYNADATPFQARSSWHNFQQKDAGRGGEAPPILMAYGYGDGGGGPTREMLENLEQMTDFPSLPRAVQGKAIDFFRRLEEVAGPKLPVWNGELYFEYHRGTYTTQARNKRHNRKTEILLHDAELLAAWANQTAEFEYPTAALQRAWELVCLNQFHDIIPGSSINEVYQDSERDYAEVYALGDQIKADALKGLGAQVSDQAQWMVVNPTSFGGQRFCVLPMEEGLSLQNTLVDLDTKDALVTQPVESGLLVELPRIGGYTLRGLGVGTANGKSISSELKSELKIETIGDGVQMENSLLQINFNRDGEMISLFDKEVGREVLPDGAVANQFQLFEDRPMMWEAWDVDIFYDDKMWHPEPATSFDIIETGPLRVGVEVVRPLDNSTIRQRIYLYHASRRIEFQTHVAWQERQTLLKVAFPVDVLNPVATYDIQWGNVERPTHRNTSWDWARFETCAHKWADLSEGNYGVSLLNDCKYGHDISENVMRLTLLRGPNYPDPEADRGAHTFTYCLYPHPGDWRNGTVAEAYALNDPLIVAPVSLASGSSAAQTLFALDADHVILETVKRAEDGKGMIVRLYENERCRGPVTLTCGLPISAAYRCNLLEANENELEVAEQAVTFDIKPYEIVTLRIQ